MSAAFIAKPSELESSHGTKHILGILSQSNSSMSVESSASADRASTASDKSSKSGILNVMHRSRARVGHEETSGKKSCIITRTASAVSEVTASSTQSPTFHLLYHSDSNISCVVDPQDDVVVPQVEESSDSPKLISYIKPEEVEIAELLGTGTFATVHGAFLSASIHSVRDTLIQRYNRTVPASRRPQEKNRFKSTPASLKDQEVSGTTVDIDSSSSLICEDLQASFGQSEPGEQSSQSISFTLDEDREYISWDSSNPPRHASFRPLRRTSSPHRRDAMSQSCSALEAPTRATPSLSIAVKQVNLKRLKSRNAREIAARDLAFEAAILSTLPKHDNIIELHAISVDFWNDPMQGFLVLEALSETLYDRLERWRSARQQRMTLGVGKGGLGDLLRWNLPRRNPNQSQRQLQRQDTIGRLLTNAESQEIRIVTIGLPLARALSFLHQHKIVYRDLKPQNVGFDRVRGQIRLFDFGLSREYHDDDDRVMTGFTGTARYMAPEVMNFERYAHSSDVYSFSILLWELCTLSKPFSRINTLAAAERAILRRNHRPPLQAIKAGSGASRSSGLSWKREDETTASFRNLLRAGWDKDPNLRPSFNLLIHELENLFVRQESF